MIHTLLGEYIDNGHVKVLHIDECSSDVQYSILDSKDKNELIDLRDEILEGSTFADFHVAGTPKDSFLELRHSSDVCWKGNPDMSVNNQIYRDELSFTGFLRVTIVQGCSVLLSKKEKSVYDFWDIGNTSSIQFTPAFGMRVSHLIPEYSEQDAWKWNSTTLMFMDDLDNFTDYTEVAFLCPFDFSAGAYEDYLDYKKDIVQVKLESGEVLPFKAVTLKKGLPVYPRKTGAMISPKILTMLQFIADSYKLSLHTLTTGYFKERTIVQPDRSNFVSVKKAEGRSFKMYPKFKPTAKNAKVFMDLLIDGIEGKISDYAIADFVRTNPMFSVYQAIVQDNMRTFFSSENMEDKHLAYRSLKSTETLIYLLISEISYSVMFDNNGLVFDRWVHNNSFKSGITNYEVQMEGGGRTWRPQNISF